MRWEGAEASGDVEDRRGMKPAVAAGGGLTALLVAAGIYFLTGDVRLAQQAGQVVANRQAQGRVEQTDAKPIDDRTRKFVTTVTGFTDQVWQDLFARHGHRYERPKVVLFAGAVQSGCGVAPSAVGPFYCPADRQVYLDPTFFDELERKLGGSKAEFSQAYVIAHEVGHHVQNLLGYADRVKRFEAREGNNGTIRLELQADYLAGVWAHHGQKKFGFIEPGDVDAALTTARAIGDNRIMAKAGRWASPESFTHGSDAQRTRHFRRGLDYGDFGKQALEAFFDPDVSPLEL